MGINPIVVKENKSPMRCLGNYVFFLTLLLLCTIELHPHHEFGLCLSGVLFYITNLRDLGLDFELK